MTQTFDSRESTLYRDAIARRRAFALPGYVTLADVDFDGDYVSPIQITCGNLTGPMLITKDWLDAPSANANRAILERQGHLGDNPFMRVIDRALQLASLSRDQIYITPVFALLTAKRSSVIPIRDRRASFRAVGQYELMGRRPVACGTDAAAVLRSEGVDHVETLHPSARGLTFETRAQRIAKALEAA